MIKNSFKISSCVEFCAQAEASACKTNTTKYQPQQISNTQRTENKTADVVIHQHSRRLLMMDILMSEIRWAHIKWNKIVSDIKLVFHSSTIVLACLIGKYLEIHAGPRRNMWRKSEENWMMRSCRICNSFQIFWPLIKRMTGHVELTGRRKILTVHYWKNMRENTTCNTRQDNIRMAL